MAALITSKNNPSVRMVTGNVNKIKIGLTMEFINASTTATISAVTILLVVTPGSMYDTSKTLNAVAINLKIKFIGI